MADFRRRVWTTRSRPPLIDEEITPSSGWIQLPEFHCLLIDLPGFKKDEIKINIEENGNMVVSGRRRTMEGKQLHFEKSFNVPEDGDIKDITTLFEQDTLKLTVPKVVATQMKDKDKDKEKTAEKKENDEYENNDKDKEKTAEKKEDYEYENNYKDKDKTVEKKDDYEYENNDKDKNKDKEDEYESSDPNCEEEAKEETAEEQQSKNNPITSNEDVIDEVKKQDENKVVPGHQQGSNPGPTTSPVIVKIIENKGILIASLVSFTLGVFLSHKFHPLPPK